MSNSDISTLVQCKAYKTQLGLSQALLDRWVELERQGLGRPCPLDREFWLHFDQGLVTSDSDDEQVGGGSLLRSGRSAEQSEHAVSGPSEWAVQPSTSAPNFTIEREHQKQYSKWFKIHCMSYYLVIKTLTHTHVPFQVMLSKWCSKRNLTLSMT